MYLLIGDNGYRVDAELKKLTEASQAVELISSETATKASLLDVARGQQLFSSKRTIVIKDLSDNKAVWQELEHIFGATSDDTTIIFLEPHVDKRTTSYKWLQKRAEVIVCDEPTSHERRELIDWLIAEAKQKSFELSRSQAELLLDRVGYHQSQLANAVDKLSLANEVNEQTIAELIDASPQENVFQLLATAFAHKSTQVQSTINELEKMENAYKVFGLVVSQLQQYTLVKYSNGSTRQIAEDTGMKEYGLQRQASVTAKISQPHLQFAIQTLAEADMRIKTGDSSPWRVLEYALMQVANYKD